MSKTTLQTALLFTALTLAGFILAAGIAPRVESAFQPLLIGTGLSLFTSGLTTLLIKLTGDQHA